MAYRVAMSWIEHRDPSEDMSNSSEEPGRTPKYEASGCHHDVTQSENTQKARTEK